MKNNVFAIDPYGRTCYVLTKQLCDCDADENKPRKMQFTRGVLRCHRCAEEFVPCRCAATASTLTSLTSEVIRAIEEDIDDRKLTHVLQIMPFEDMFHVVFAAIHQMLEPDFRYSSLENVVDMDILGDVLSAVQRRVKYDNITSPRKRTREEDA